MCIHVYTSTPLSDLFIFPSHSSHLVLTHTSSNFNHKSTNSNYTRPHLTPFQVSNCAPSNQCVSNSNPDLPFQHWRNPTYSYQSNELSGTEFSFDDCLRALVTLFEMSSLELWMVPMYFATGKQGLGLGIHDFSFWFLGFCVFACIRSVLVVFNLGSLEII